MRRAMPAPPDPSLSRLGWPPPGGDNMRTAEAAPSAVSRSRLGWPPPGGDNGDRDDRDALNPALRERSNRLPSPITRRRDHLHRQPRTGSQETGR